MEWNTCYDLTALTVMVGRQFNAKSTKNLIVVANFLLS